MQSAEMKIVRFGGSDIVTASDPAATSLSFKFGSVMDTSFVETLTITGSKNGTKTWEDEDNCCGGEGFIELIAQELIDNGIVNMEYNDFLYSSALWNAKFYLDEKGDALQYDEDADGHLQYKITGNNINKNNPGHVSEDFTTARDVTLSGIPSYNVGTKYGYSFTYNPTYPQTNPNLDHILYDSFTGVISALDKTPVNFSEEDLIYANVVYSDDSTSGLAQGASSTQAIHDIFESTEWMFKLEGGVGKFIAIKNK